ncbi:MAG: hydrogenase maturation protease [Solirubrobacterales bacterium]|nr:hydrogenase maturation protease [Solirubrobacterales bacterium]
MSAETPHDPAAAYEALSRAVRPEPDATGVESGDQSPKRILVAGIGNAWMKDDGFGGKVAQRLDGVELPAGVAVFDFGTGGLDLAYEVMRGYDALLIVDVSRQGGTPGTLYVMDADPDEIEPIGDGESISPHGMDPQTVLRFIKTVGGWPGKVVVIACEPGVVEEMGIGLSPDVEEAVGRAAELVLETIAELRTDAAYEDLG